MNLPLILSLVLIQAFVFVSGGFVAPKVDPAPVQPVPIDPIPIEPVPADPNPASGSGSSGKCPDCGVGGTGGIHAGPVPGTQPGAGNTGGEGNDLAEHLSELADMILTLVSLAQGSESSTATLIPTMTAMDVTTTAAPAVTTAKDSNANACLVANSMFSSCNSNSSGFYSEATSVQASCLCYSTNALTSPHSQSVAPIWQPQWFDGLMIQCENYVQTQTQTVNSSIAAGIKSGVGLCSVAMDVRATAASASANQTATQASYPTAPMVTAVGSRVRGREALVMALGIALGRAVL